MDSRELARRIRISALEMVTRAGASHIGSSLSQADILAVLYSGGANVTPKDWGAESDSIIVSKGHAAASTYAALAHSGFFPLSWLESFCRDGSPFLGHVTAGEIPGVEFSTGSLGHGLGFGVGVSLAAKLDGIPKRTFVIMSDGECDEGSVWEAALLGAHHELDNLVAIVDRNRLQSFGSTESTLRLEPLDDKWRAFGWEVIDINGHDHSAISAAVSGPQGSSPRVLIANTIKGAGVSFMEDRVEWHYRSPRPDELSRALDGLVDN